MFRKLLPLLLPLFALAQSHSAWADEQPLTALTQEEPAFYVQADVDRADRFYRDGDPLRVSVICESEAYIYVLYQQADGKVFQIFPNSAQANNKVPAKEKISIPAQDDRFRWTISAPFGKETVKVIASKTPVDVLGQKELRQGRFNAVSTQQVKDTVNALQQEEVNAWTESIVEITTAARDAQTPRQGRRFGVFFGASEYEFNAEVLETTGGKWQPKLPCSANNAIVMARLMKSMGQLDDFVLCVNEQSTKANFRHALTEWLPSVSRPGDTIFIMYCGHGGQIKDDNGDERDGKDEYLLMHDYVDMSVLRPLMKKAEGGTLPEKLKPRYAKWLEIYRRAGADHAHDALLRETCVSDDLLGHWLQRLSGRQILLMCDTCHAAGFVVNEKGFQSPQSPLELEFLDSEIGRLKDLGQVDQALLAACDAQASSYGQRHRDAVIERWKSETKGIGEERVIENLAVFSYYLVDGLVALPPPLTAAQLQEHCRTGMKEYFITMNDLLRKNKLEPLIEHAPSFYNYSKRPIVMKP